MSEHEHDWTSDLDGQGMGVSIDTYPSQTVYICRNGCGLATHEPKTGEPCRICTAMYGEVVPTPSEAGK